MRVGVPLEVAGNERRVALTPDAVSRLTATGLEIAVEAGAGSGASLPDDSYREAGAHIVDSAQLFAESDIVVRVGRIDASEAARLHPVRFWWDGSGR